MKIPCKVTQANGADLRYDNTDPTVSDSPLVYIPFSLTVPSLLLDSKSQMSIVILRIKSLFEQIFGTREIWFYGIAGVDFLPLTSIYWAVLPLDFPRDALSRLFFIISDDAAKHYKLQILKANLFIFKKLL